MEADDLMIAQLLAEENPYQIHEFDEEGYDDPDDSDYSGSPAPKKARKTGSATTKRKRRGGRTSWTKESKAVGDKAEDVKPEESPKESDKRSATGRRKRKDTGVRKTKGRSWTPKEEELFQAGLELHGRDWKKCASHVGSRSPRSLTSHAQKHFIKLCMKGIPLPEKVLESGCGYTLSGKPLDPTSTSAKAYGFNPHALKKLPEKEYKVSVSGVLADKLAESEKMIAAPVRRKMSKPSSEVSLENIAPVETANAVPSASQMESCEGAQVENNSGRDPPASTNSLVDCTNGSVVACDQTSEASLIGDPTLEEDKGSRIPVSQATTPEPSTMHEMTEYARSRPRRAMKARTRMGDTSEVLDLVECLRFMGMPGSKSQGAQPYSVEVYNQALLVMDCHSHMSQCEIIGLLGGSWDPDNRHLTVLEAFPCAREEGSVARTSVELGAEAELEVRAKMEKKGLTTVGWYHSHPIFEPAPSRKDMENQRNYQALFRDEISRSEPFVGFIVGPFDPQLLAPQSVVNAFVVQEKGGLLCPYKIQYSISGSRETPTPETIEKLHNIVDDLTSDNDKMDLTEQWRPFTTLVNGNPTGPSITKLHKFKKSLKSYFPPENEPDAESFVHALFSHIETSWGVTLGLKECEDAITAVPDDGKPVE